MIGDGSASLARPDDRANRSVAVRYVRIREGGKRSQRRRGAPRGRANFSDTTLAFARLDRDVAFEPRTHEGVWLAGRVEPTIGRAATDGCSPGAPCHGK